MEPDKPALVIVICPCCAGTVDAEPSTTAFSCEACGQHWTMTIDPDRFARSSFA
jgi:hypothetical protein